jgi:hypothetical protein
VVRKWLLPTLSEVLAKAEPTGIELLVPESSAPQSQPHDNAQMLQLQAQHQWQSAIAAVETLLLQALPSPMGLSDLSEETVFEGLLLTAPLPLFGHPAIVSQLQTITFTTAHTQNQRLLPSKATNIHERAYQSHHFPIELLPTDPLAKERFCLALTSQFSVLVVLGEDNGVPQCQFSFDPNDLDLAWKSLRGRMMLTAPHHLAYVDELATRFSPIAPDYRWVMAFGQHLLQHQPVISVPIERPAPAAAPPEVPAKVAADVELLQALTHEIRTPLTTIRTMTKSLLRQPELSQRVLKRLSAIDRECTEQIERMELIFSAVELATTQPSPAPDLTTMSISQLLEKSLPQWQQQAERRNLDLAVEMPTKLPAVVSNPTILDRVLTGLVENFTRNLPSGSRIQVEVTPVGDRLKLQLQSQPETDECEHTAPSKRHSVGQLLTFQPETGNLSLNMNVTKNLFQLLGGKLIVRQHPHQGEVLTIFLPLSMISG